MNRFASLTLPNRRARPVWEYRQEGPLNPQVPASRLEYRAGRADRARGRIGARFPTRGSSIRARTRAIIDQGLWDAAHAILAQNNRQRTSETWQRRQPEALLLGLFYTASGEKYQPAFTKKPNGKRYRYYVPNRKVHFGADASPAGRAPAEAIEQMVLAQIHVALRNGAAGECGGSGMARIIQTGAAIHRQGRQGAKLATFIPLRIKRHGGRKVVIPAVTGDKMPAQAPPGLARRARKNPTDGGWVLELVVQRRLRNTVQCGDDSRS